MQTRGNRPGPDPSMTTEQKNHHSWGPGKGPHTRGKNRKAPNPHIKKPGTSSQKRSRIQVGLFQEGTQEESGVSEATVPRKENKTKQRGRGGG